MMDLLRTGSIKSSGLFKGSIVKYRISGSFITIPVAKTGFIKI